MTLIFGAIQILAITGLILGTVLCVLTVVMVLKRSNVISTHSEIHHDVKNIVTGLLTIIISCYLTILLRAYL